MSTPEELLAERLNAAKNINKQRAGQGGHEPTSATARPKGRPRTVPGEGETWASIKKLDFKLPLWGHNALEHLSELDKRDPGKQAILLDFVAEAVVAAAKARGWRDPRESSQ